ncbi:multidrug/biocide efflux PACE transporter [Dickeya fangzhongdai]|uniref:Na(+)-translocating NADH-quinone reductase subunit E n=1 Tax=Dickeya fangzhongdai TaxID=1778540 RepID=A0A2K8QIN9_9GAMM|nr:multidrug/biocide efflux PACE transporter [Dickeya fangzhongdai]ATZ93334.1 Na(+)-translocating NADH-quinone reductase subunit E [Dickeya fangzhongdai]MBO8132526.1 multidrug/biocide efflux PACE transporter [Dickeya fangzhongdai]QOH46766.1 multidrug/biocide efflux PACE transporter [Dickeya fangzhongdai]QOH51071.1 multidrug/biocide efflux PACE transporter [Dickeya fangzhongdai]UMB77697.1 multidrug/biocide efflux PACE transporter [Dickeya fangzhongdai]
MQQQVQRSARHEHKTLRERMAHAVGFEVMALLICAPIGAWVLGRSILQVGALSIMLSSVAMVWNVAYNSLFDRLWPVSRIRRGLWVRMGHALGFEGGFILIGLPLAAWMLDITLWQALMVEIGFFLFFLPYTMAYNWLYDLLRERLLATAVQGR